MFNPLVFNFWPTFLMFLLCAIPFVLIVILLIEVIKWLRRH